MINLILLTSALLQLPSDTLVSNDIKSTLKTMQTKAFKETWKPQQHSVSLDNIEQRLSMEIMANLDDEFESMLAKIDDELTSQVELSVETHSTMEKLTQQNAK
ncbi:hypothetical protein [Shewanella woodyi]|uniref:hypothetical protein n=1 Tax=Shewanella woodyi TaxID=60961 RepID=UPI003749FA3A